MIIFPSSCWAVCAASLLVGCAENLPDGDTEIGRLLRISSNTELEAEFEAYAAERRHDGSNFESELVDAGFYKPEWQPAAQGCDGYVWFGRPWGAIFERGVGVDICPTSVRVSASYDGL